MAPKKPYFIRIKVIDKQGNNIENAKATLTVDNKTVNFQHSPKTGHYLQLTEPGRLLVDLGDCVLAVSASGYSTLEQKFVLRAHKGGNLTFTRKKGFPLYANVNLTRGGGKASDTWGPLNFVLTVTLYEPSEVVMVAGYDYAPYRKRGEVFFEEYCDSRVYELEKEGIINKGTIVTYFNFKDGNKKTLRKIRGGIGKKERWKKIKVETQGDGAPLKREYKNKVLRTKRNTISITHVYDYIIGVGKERPGTIKEFSIFSHAWLSGPILLNSIWDFQSAVDGYALKSIETEGATLTNPKIFEITTNNRIKRKQAKKVLANSPIPKGADAVIQLAPLAADLGKKEGKEILYVRKKLLSLWNFSNARNPNDKDGRVIDFEPINMPKLPLFKKAFHRDSVIRIWGCNKFPGLQRNFGKLLKAKSDTEPVTISYEGPDGKTIKNTTTRKDANIWLRNLMTNMNYPSYIAKASGVKTYSALPGMGSSFARCGKERRKCMRIRKQYKGVKQALDYYQRHLNITIDKYGYGLYKP